ncbi:MAG: non-lysosomal glucosylceramidase [Candidatus Saccharicenans sp.]|nr:non-lysosomal glucosylceramidase [Candidatus Saccharicenans sp.]
MRDQKVLCLPTGRPFRLLLVSSILFLLGTGSLIFGQAAGKKEKAMLPGFEFRFQPAPPSLAGFPDSAFTRPFGYKMEKFGRTAAEGNIDNNAEGSACPVGGLGSGGYEWTISGNFRYWFLKSGWYVDDWLPADAFHVLIKKGNQKIVQTLSADKPERVLQSWNWGLVPGSGDYYALYPKSGFSFEKKKDWPVRLAVVQFSPVIPHNYRESSYPVAIYKWIIHNPSKAEVEVSLMLTWENMVGWEAVWPGGAVPQTQFVWDKKSQGNFSEFQSEGQKKGIIFRRRGLDLKTGNALGGTMGISVLEIPGAEVSHLTDFDPTGEGWEVMGPFVSSGRLPSTKAEGGSKSGRTASALALSIRVKPGQKIEVPFAISWDFPYYEFEKGVKYRKKYTEFFGDDGQQAMKIAFEALDKYLEWEKAIDNWQVQILAHKKLPAWFKQLLFNELYILSETSIWDASTDLFTYLESADYLMYGTFDVDSYCWQLLELWPELEWRNIRYFAQTIKFLDPAYKVYQYNVTFPHEVPADKKGYYWNMNKEQGMVPHDLGSPRVRPWVVLNAFDWQNGNVWKDLNPKFPLRALRDYLASGRNDPDYLREVFSASVQALDTLERKFGHPVSHIPQNEAIPDQTYDTWRMKGTSAYVGLLWLAALKATIRLGDLLLEKGISQVEALNVDKVQKKYADWLKAGREDVMKLWNEDRGYFHIDSHNDDIMTDQLFGAWYASMLGLEDREPVVNPEQVKRALVTIFRNNVAGFGDGLMGAVNGRSASGRQLLSQQGDEVWVGTTYAFSANCLKHGLTKEAWQTAYGIYRVVWSPEGQGYFFKTPEAYLNPEEQVWNNPAQKYGHNLFRAMKYMRPGAVWAVYRAWLETEK